MLPFPFNAAEGRPRRLLLGDQSGQHFQQPLEAVFFKEPGQQFAVDVRPRTPLLEIHVQRNVQSQDNQLSAHAGLVGVFPQVPAEFLALDRVRVLQDVFQAAELMDEFQGGLLADARHPGYVVGRIAHEREHVDHLLGRHAPLALKVFRSERAVVPCIKHANPGAQQLLGVLVARNNEGFDFLRFGTFGDRRDDVVRLKALDGEDRHAECVYHVAYQGYLRLKFRRHLLSSGLVFIVAFMPERLARGVHGHDHVIRPDVREQPHQEVREPVDGVDRRPVGSSQPADCVEGLIEVRVSIYEKESLGHASPPGKTGTEPTCHTWISAPESGYSQLAASGKGNQPASIGAGKKQRSELTARRSDSEHAPSVKRMVGI